MGAFKDKVAIVTGGGAGIRLATARLLAEKGAKVLTGRREGALDAVVASNPSIKGLVADASDPEAAGPTVAAAVNEAEKNHQDCFFRYK